MELGEIIKIIKLFSDIKKVKNEARRKRNTKSV